MGFLRESVNTQGDALKKFLKRYKFPQDVPQDKIEEFQCCS